MPFDFDDYFDALEDSPFEEIPVDIERFVEGHEYLNQPPLSPEQYSIVEASTQIFKRDTLIALHGFERGLEIWNKTVVEVICQLGKASGKDFCATIAAARIVYFLLCLKDPQQYYNKPPGNSIDLLNIAINSDQAKNVFFKNFKTMIEKSKWFEDKYVPKSDYIEFDKNITCYSGHSERESWEGYNLIYCCLDEIAGFAVESSTGNERGKTAEAIYKMYRASVSSRFELGKVALLSFPRYVGDFIQTRYESVIAEKEVLHFTHKFKLDEDLPDGVDENEFEIEWTEDRIISYREPQVFALKLPTWKVNPTRPLSTFRGDAFRDPVDFLSRYACMPPEAVDAFFKSREKVETAFSGLHIPFDDEWKFKEWFQPKKDKWYYIHADLAAKHDRAVVAMSHVETWVQNKFMGELGDPSPLVKVDAVRYWTPRSDQSINLTEIKQFILSLRQRGFDIKRVTFDRWSGSFQTIDDLKLAGMEVETLSVTKEVYEDLALLVAEERVKGYRLDLLIGELLKLRVVKDNKVEGPRKGHDDLADAVAGSVYNAVTLTPRNIESEEIEIHYIEQMNPEPKREDPPGVIKAPPRPKMPEGLEAALERLTVI